ncbi:hypothetical protein QMO17_32990, partial [Klebsiella pneumoniae]|nr:hypothetical protein [Klebsiella pneumoniae]
MAVFLWIFVNGCVGAAWQHADDGTTGNLRESIRLRGLSGRRQPAIIQAADGAGQRPASNGAPVSSDAAPWWSWRLIPAPPTAGFRAHHDRFAVQPDLLGIQSRRGRRVDVEGNIEHLPDMGIFHGQFPRQKHLDVILIRPEVSRVEATTVALNNAMRLACIE